MRSGGLSRRDFFRRGAAGGILMSRLSNRILGANDKIRLGVVGCGGRGNYLIDQVLESAPQENVEVAALCDVWSVNLAKTVEQLTAAQARAPFTSSRYQDLLEMPDLDAVVIATPDFAHTPILIEAVKAGKDAFVEKPMATRMRDANLALDLVHERGCIVQVGTQRRSESRYQAAAELIQSGVLGKVSEIEAGWHDSKPRWARDYSLVRESDVDWTQYLMFLPPEPFSAQRFRCWHLYEDFTVGTPGLLGSHLIDVATWFMADPLPSSAVAHGGVYVWQDGREHADTMDCLLEYPKGFLLNYSTRLGNEYPNSVSTDRPLPTTFYGTQGTFDTYSWTVQGLGGGQEAISEPVTVMTGQDEEGHVQNWLRCLRSRQSPNAPVETGYAHSVASIMCFRAWKTGRRQLYDSKTRQVVAG